MKLEQGRFCPLIKKDCIELQCSWFTPIRGTNPNTGESVDEWACAINWLPMLLIENSDQQRKTSAAVLDFRNESIQRSDLMNTILFQASQGHENRDAIQPVELKEILPG